jgi:hypothetical protein
MGMDVYGQQPTTDEGEYFRNNAWWWRPLAKYVQNVAPEIAAKCKYWHSNDGDGLNSEDSLALADVLQAELDSGRTATYKRLYDGELARLQKEPCKLCEGTGTRKPPPMEGAGDPKADGIKCNGCNGEGYEPDWRTHYSFEVENVQKFVTFLRGCGGFAIR